MVGDRVSGVCGTFVRFDIQIWVTCGRDVYVGDVRIGDVDFQHAGL